MVGFSSSRMGSRKALVAIFDYQMLEAATNKFSKSNVLSEGGSGIVYRALLDEKVLVAVKKVEITGSDAERKFDVMFSHLKSKTGFCALFFLISMSCFLINLHLKLQNEVNWLTKIWHQNIIKLLGYCIRGKTRLFVYEMMQNGSLETQLHGKTYLWILTENYKLALKSKNYKSSIDTLFAIML